MYATTKDAVILFETQTYSNLESLGNTVNC